MDQRVEKNSAIVEKLNNANKVERLQKQIQSSINQYSTLGPDKQKYLLGLETMKQILNEILIFEKNIHSAIDYNLNMIMEKADITILEITKFATKEFEGQDILENLFKKLQQQISESIQKSLNYFENLFKKLNQFIQENDQYCISETISKNINSSQQQRFEYRLHTSYDLQKECAAIAFNYDSSIMIAGVEGNIIVYSFKDEKLRETQSLQGDSWRIDLLQFMNNNKSGFISVGCKNQILIWEQTKNKEYKIHKILKGHSNFIKQVIINKLDDYLISASIDKTIKFWSKNIEWSCSQTLIFSSYVYSISLNKSETQIIVSEANNLISVIEYSQTYWFIKAQIAVQMFGSKLCFLGDDEFSFQLHSGNLLYIYKYDDQKQKYLIKQELAVFNGVKEMGGFPQYFNYEKGFLVSKNCEFIFFITKRANSGYLIDQTIQFGTSSLFGGVSPNGNYLATWDQQSKKLQIRKLFRLE